MSVVERVRGEESKRRESELGAVFEELVDELVGGHPRVLVEVAQQRRHP